MSNTSNYTVHLARPVITSYPDIANLLALSGDYTGTDYEPYYMDWFIAQYINYYIILPWDDEKVARGYNILFDDPFHANRIFESKILQMHHHHMYDIKEDFSAFVLANLQNGYAVHSWLTRKYLVKGDGTFRHEGLIYAYNPQTDNFLVNDFFDMGIYQSKEVPRQNLDAAFFSSRDLYYSDRLSYRDTHVFAARSYRAGEMEFYPLFQYDKYRMSYLLSDYIRGARYDDRVCGSLCYDEMLSRINSVPLSQFDMRALHLLYDHKVALTTSIRHLAMTGRIQDGDMLLQDAEKLAILTLSSRNLCLKYFVQQANESTYKEKLCKNLIEIRDFERRLLLSLQKQVEKN